MKNFEPRPLHEQVMIITGATSGIGLATALMAGKSGAKVVVNSRNHKELRKVVKRIKDEGGHALAVAGDISRRETAHLICDKAIENFGRIDTWVNNAGVAVYGDLLEEKTIADERRLFEVNFWGTRYASLVAVNALSQSGGTLINIGSELSELAPPVLGLYSASKHAVKAFTDSLRVEVKSKNLPVYVSLVRPTSIATPMPEHGANHLQEGEPSLPSLLYHPDVVATLILKCAVTPQRDVFVGAQARLSSLSASLFPALTDAIAALRAPAMKQGMPKPHVPGQENLHSIPDQEGEVLGEYDRPIVHRSLFSSLKGLLRWDSGDVPRA